MATTTISPRQALPSPNQILSLGPNLPKPIEPKPRFGKYL
ncbi:hypothetical protein COLO4_14460 [Corchorus olitorius]|uniref:Uncharacterized protein n=1 Tax=Corchorus olitorius TaxID=93759 RepID=A0A1R3JSB9_9ROSI|nr:hypothetical protein COLO4_14460 [Corchorus olitorius]